eukprot:TRINITY_DN60610_c0_g1_i1.p1 TRINITY_DN60610_c0_g1~~TRINITY_DN60610_c0_g1_i1.p1  ORF type:complete len:329 (+),score=135.72 TRINITY_DN60610_c0_g1_i1:78-989(+)
MTAFDAFSDADGAVNPLWKWYGGMLLVCVLGNIAFVSYAWGRVRPADSYERKMKWLALPWVGNCAWRSVFPSLYLQRYVFWDTPLNSIMVDRCWACAGELCWVYQTALALRHIDTQITGGKRWIQWSAWAAFWVYVLAEFVSYYNVATTNEFWCAVEVTLDGISYLIMSPASFYLFCRCPGKACCGSSAKLYLLVMCVVCLAYPFWNFHTDAPMYMQRYRDDQSHHKKYFKVIPGLEDAAMRRIPTHDYNDWKADLPWMTMYFSIGAWSGILMMFAPRLSGPEKEGPAQLEDPEAAELAEGSS